MSDFFIILCLILCPIISLWSGFSYIIILCLILCPIISLWSGFSYIQERRKRRYVFRSRR
ncbi:small membrane protein [Klebsiella pneumoniae]